MFPDTPVHFDDGEAQVPEIQAQQAFPKEIRNINATLTWSASLDSGATFAPFAQTHHKIFVTIGRPRGFDGGQVPPYTKPPRPHLTAARMNQVTRDLNGLTTRPFAAYGESVAVYSQVTAGYNSLFQNPPPAGLEEVYSNPWAVLDQDLKHFDCLSLALLASVQLRQVGIDSDVSAGWATSDGDASNKETWTYGDSPGIPVGLQYMDNDTNWNWYEGFVFTRKLGQSMEAFTAFPPDGPIPPQPPDSNGPPFLPTDTLGLLNFGVLRHTLINILTYGGSDPRIGQQWWVDSQGNSVGDAVPFPRPLQ